MIGEAVGRERGQLFLELPKVPRASDFELVRGAEYEVAEAQVLAHEQTELLEERRRALLEEGRADRARQLLVLRAAGLEHHGDVGLAVADPEREHDSRVSRNLSVFGELDVRDDAEDVLLVVHEVPPRVLVGAREEDLGLGLEPHQLV